MSLALSHILTKANLNLDFISFSQIQKLFKPEQILRGRMVQRLQNNLFVFRTKGLSLIAEATVPLNAGDIVTVKVQKNQRQIELKLLEVNGKPVKDGQNIPIPNFQYARLPVPREFMGREGFLEIYNYQNDENEFSEGQEPILSFQLLLEMQNSEFIVIKAYHLGNSQEFRIYSTDQEFSKFLNSYSKMLLEWLLDKGTENIAVQILHQKYQDLFRPATEIYSAKTLNLTV